MLWSICEYLRSILPVMMNSLSKTPMIPVASAQHQQEWSAPDSDGTHRAPGHTSYLNPFTKDIPDKWGRAKRRCGKLRAAEDYGWYDNSVFNAYLPRDFTNSVLNFPWKRINLNKNVKILIFIVIPPCARAKNPHFLHVKLLRQAFFQLSGNLQVIFYHFIRPSPIKQHWWFNKSSNF